MQVQVQWKRKLNVLKKENRLFTDVTQLTLSGFDMNSGRWGPEACLQLQLIAYGGVRNNVTQIFGITTLKNIDNI